MRNPKKVAKLTFSFQMALAILYFTQLWFKQSFGAAVLFCHKSYHGIINGFVFSEYCISFQYIKAEDPK